jgi:hypothetical protein
MSHCNVNRVHHLNKKSKSYTIHEWRWLIADKQCKQVSPQKPAPTRATVAHQRATELRRRPTTMSRLDEQAVLDTYIDRESSISFHCLSNQYYCVSYPSQISLPTSPVLVSYSEFLVLPKKYEQTTHTNTMAAILTSLNTQLEEVLRQLESEAVTQELQQSLHNHVKGALPDPEMKRVAN